MRTCNNCRFAKMDGQDGQNLTCYRLPPATILMPTAFQFMWPVVRPSSWCGEWKLAWKRLFRGHVSA